MRNLESVDSRILGISPLVLDFLTVLLSASFESSVTDAVKKGGGRPDLHRTVL